MEAFGISLIEAMAYALPVIAAPVGGIPEIISDRVEGRFWPIDDPKRAARILVNTLEDKSTMSQMGRAACKRFVTHFDTSVVFPRVRDFLLEASMPIRQT
jgi:glycosyltransferase involved in cell wall biosynthesis